MPNEGLPTQQPAIRLVRAPRVSGEQQQGVRACEEARGSAQQENRSIEQFAPRAARKLASRQGGEQLPRTRMRAVRAL